MTISERKITVERTAHYYTYGNLNQETREIWIAAHGYGQTAERFISKFSCLDETNTFVIAPEGLSKFYWQGVRGQFAASWMTSKNRMDEIDDFCNYLDEIYNRYILSVPSAKVILIGFSQGSTTLYRWIFRRKKHFDFFINWAGWFPEDIAMSSVKEMFDQKHMIVAGRSDQYLTRERLDAVDRNLEKEGYHPVYRFFDGKHQLDKKTLQHISQNIPI